MSSRFYTAQLLGLAAVSFQTGLQWSFSYLVIPLVLAANDPKTKVTLWKAMAVKGMKIGPAVGALASGTLACVAYLAPNPAVRRFYITATIIPALVVPYAWVFVDKTNKFLWDKKAGYDNQREVRTEDDAQITAAVEKWRDLNYGRTILPAAATVMAIVGLLQRK